MNSMRSARFGVKVKTNLSVKKAADKNQVVLERKQKRIDICTGCPNPDCKKGICKRYKEKRDV